MKSIYYRLVIAATILGFAGCNLEDIGNNEPVFTCNATATVHEMCLEEPNSLSTQAVSKSNCLESGGSWSDSKRCPSNYEKKCKDADKTHYYYATTDAAKSCTSLVGFRLFSPVSP